MTPLLLSVRLLAWYPAFAYFVLYADMIKDRVRFEADPDLQLLQAYQEMLQKLAKVTPARSALVCLSEITTILGDLARVVFGSSQRQGLNPMATTPSNGKEVISRRSHCEFLYASLLGELRPRNQHKD
jgi:hypothetical protein